MHTTALPGRSRLLLPALLALAAAATAQEPLGELPVELARAHHQAVASERMEAIRALWREAPPERREELVELFHRHRRPYDRALVEPSIELLCEARRVLLEGSAAAGDAPWQQRLAESLDLRVAPGAFQSREEGAGEPMTVRVRPLHDAKAAAPVSLHLRWISPTGEEERARTEPILPEAWRSDGFDMYIRPPASAPGRWLLVPELEESDRTWRGLGVPVDCVAELGRRFESLAALMADQPRPATSALGPRIAAWVGLGVRPAAPLPVGTWLDLALGESPAAGSAPIALELTDLGGGPGLAWTFPDAPDDPDAPVLVLATHGGEHPLALLAGSLGPAWHELARSLGAVLIATDLSPLESERGATLLELVRQLGTERAAPLVLVLRGDAGALFPSRLRREGLAGVDRLVLCGPPGGGARPELRLDLPVLALDALANEEERVTGGGEGAPWTWIRRREPPFLADLAAPAEIGAWLEPGDEPERGER